MIFRTIEHQFCTVTGTVEGEGMQSLVAVSLKAGDRLIVEVDRLVEHGGIDSPERVLSLEMARMKKCADEFDRFCEDLVAATRKDLRLELIEEVREDLMARGPA